MSIEIRVGPAQLAIHQGHSVLLCEPDGQIQWPSHKGLYFYDTRVISSWSVYANGEPWDLLNGGATTSFAERIFLANRELVTEAGPIASHTVGLVLSRHIGGGIHEDVDLMNYGASNVRFNLEIAVRSDFADIFEVKSGHFVRRGNITTEWDREGQRLTTAYRNGDFAREVTVTARNGDAPAGYANGRITFDVELAPAATWHTCLAYDLLDGETWISSTTMSGCATTMMAERASKCARVCNGGDGRDGRRRHGSGHDCRRDDLRDDSRL